MIAESRTLTVETRGQGLYEITSEAREFVAASGLAEGSLTVFARHTSASLLLFENADPTARLDCEAFFARLAPEDPDAFSHTLEGPDDMPAHLRMALTRSSETIPVAGRRLLLGTWQGLFLFEHRRRAQRREVVLSVLGH